MQVIQAPGFSSANPVPELGPSPDLEQAVALLKKGEVSPALSVGNKVVVALVNDVIPARPSTFEEVRGEIENTMVANRTSAALQKHATELVEKANAMGGDLEKAAKSMGLDVKTSNPVDRSGNIEGIGAASYLTEAFTKPDGSVIGPIGVPDGGHRGQSAFAYRRRPCATGGPAQHYPRRHQEPARPRAQHAV